MSRCCCNNSVYMLMTMWALLQLCGRHTAAAFSSRMTRHQHQRYSTINLNRRIDKYQHIHYRPPLTSRLYRSSPAEASASTILSSDDIAALEASIQTKGDEIRALKES